MSRRAFAAVCGVCEKPIQSRAWERSLDRGVYVVSFICHGQLEEVEYSYQAAHAGYVANVFMPQFVPALVPDALIYATFSIASLGDTISHATNVSAYDELNREHSRMVRQFQQKAEEAKKPEETKKPPVYRKIAVLDDE